MNKSAKLKVKASKKFDFDENGFRCAARTLYELHFGVKIKNGAIFGITLVVPNTLTFNLAKFDLDENGF